MKTFARVSNIIFYVIEVLCVLGAVTGFLFKTLQLEGANALLMLSFFLFACIYFFRSFTPFYKKYISELTVYQQGPHLILRRILYFMLGWLVFSDLFFILNLDGRETLGLIVLPLVIVLVLIAFVLIVLKSERRLVLQWSLLRIVFFLALYFKVWNSASPY